MKKKLVIFDLDGTVADIEHRRHFVTNGNSDWRSFNESCCMDLPNVPVIETLLAHIAFGNKIMFVSGRNESVRGRTIDWLRLHVLKNPNSQEDFGDSLLMRPDNCYTSDDELKLKWLNDGLIPKSKILCVFDDRDKVVKMWRSQGIPCFQVATGDF